MMPPVETAARIPLSPSGLNPFAACRLLGWKLTKASTKIVSSGIATFHQVAAELVAASFLTPMKLIAVIRPIRTTATTMPLVVSTPVFGCSQLCAKL